MRSHASEDTRPTIYWAGCSEGCFILRIENVNLILDALLFARSIQLGGPMRDALVPTFSGNVTLKAMIQTDFRLQSLSR